MFGWAVALHLTLGAQLILGLIPEPAHIEYANEYYHIPLEIDVEHNAPFCFVLHAAVKRLLQNLRLKHLVIDRPTSIKGSVTKFFVNISSACDELSNRVFKNEGSTEAYNVSISNGGVRIDAPEVWGALHGLISVAQLARSTIVGERLLPGVNINDYPRWPFRSFLVDTSRHFIPMGKLLEFINIMETAKFNVFHWHIVDDNSFPYESYTFPKLASKGSFSAAHATYTQHDVRFVIEHARTRGIRVMPEFDTPGHTKSWGCGYQALLTPCYSGDKPNGKYGPVDPTRNVTYDFMAALFKEIGDVFPDTAVHLGGDEVDFGCWQSNPDIQDFMREMKFNSSYYLLEDYYISRLLDTIGSTTKKKIKPYVWQEVYDNKVNLNNAVTVHVWKDFAWQTELNLITKSGYEAVFSSCWYLNIIKYAEDWIDHYRCDPARFSNNETRLALLKGGGATMWSEYVDTTNLVSRSWPRGAVVGERLWSPATMNDVGYMRTRLTAYTCWLLSMGFSAEPTTLPGYCEYS